MGILDEALDRAAQDAVSQPLPQSAPARMRHLVQYLGGSVRAAAQALGTSPRTVRRYMRGVSRHPRPALAAALEEQLRRHWKPGLQRAALKRAKEQGFTIEARARFGYSAPGGTTDDPRLRLITQYIPPASARPILNAHQRGAPEEQQRQQLADALARHYFRDNGRRAQGLDVEFADVEYMDVDL